MTLPVNWVDNTGQQVNAAYLNALDATVNSAIQPATLAVAQRRAIDPQTASYTLALSDVNKAVEITSATPTNVTVPPNSAVAFAIGDMVEVDQMGAGQVTLVAGTGVTLRTASSLVTRTFYSAVFLRKQAINTWLVYGDTQAGAAVPTLAPLNVTSTTANLSWTPLNAVVTEIGRDGFDSVGNGPWSGAPDYTIGNGFLNTPLGALIPSTTYDLHAIINGVRLDINVTTLAAPAVPPTITSISPNPGPAGLVTINGVNFIAGTTVTFAGVAATGVSIVSSTQLTCTAPAHADGAVSVVATSSAGASSAFTFTYQASGSTPATIVAKAWLLAADASGPTRSWMDPVYFVAGTGTKTVATASKFDGNGTITYSLQGTIPAGVTINSSTGVVSISTAANIPWTTVIVRATNSLGFSEVEFEMWVFTPTTTITAGVTNLNSLVPAAGAIVAVHAGTWSTTQDLSGWTSGTSANPITLVAYPGEVVLFNGASIGSPFPCLYPGPHDIVLRGMKFDGGSSCLFSLWTNNSTRMKIAQCEIVNFWQDGIDLEQGSSNWTIEYNRIHHNVTQNIPFVIGSAWGEAIAKVNVPGCLTRRNRIYQNGGEGEGYIHQTSGSSIQNIFADNWSITGVYIDIASNIQVHGNIVWYTDPAYLRTGSQHTIVGMNEDATAGQDQTGNSATNNFILSGNDLPQFNAVYGGNGGTSVWAPNYSFSSVDSRWLT